MGDSSQTADKGRAIEVAGKPESGATTAGALVISLRDVLIILAAFLGIFLALILVLSNGRLTTTSDIVAVLSVVISGISTITAAAFGVAVGAQAGSQAGQAVAAETKRQVAGIRNQALPNLERLEEGFKLMESEMLKLPLENRAFDLNPDATSRGPSQPIAIPQELLGKMRMSLGAIRGALETLPG
uniref:Uncharacterized protein n=1 Tax=Thermogemmatispora argillosa TaxID=2045280 RepID=A0A455SZL7_9CHLR|nr:hypothetical protein KTA_05510 [Thermogemmatispora argillosa]